VDDVRGPIAEHFADLFDTEVTERHGADARAFLRAMAGER
jgi:lipoyl(octanoyl) transferase